MLTAQLATHFQKRGIQPGDLVALTGDQLGYNAASFAQMTHLTAEDSVLVAAPNFHVAGFSGLTLAAFATNCDHQLRPPLRTPLSAPRDPRTHRPPPDLRHLDGPHHVARTF